jgi:hypothetical protein
VNTPRRIYPLLLAVAVAVSCGPPQPPGRQQPDRQGGPDPTLSSRELSGKVFVTGSEPHTQVTLVPAEGRGVPLVGNLQGELARLSGAEVRVSGVRVATAPRDGFKVESYQVTSVDGEVPIVGILTAAVGGALTLVGTDTVELSNVPDELRTKTDAKVWIVGQSEAGKLAVQSFGVLREASE